MTEVVDDTKLVLASPNRFHPTLPILMLQFVIIFKTSSLQRERNIGYGMLFDHSQRKIIQGIAFDQI